MKHRPLTFRNSRAGARALTALTVAIAALLPAVSTRAADVLKQNNVDALNLPSSWVDLTVPGAEDIAVWNITVAAANTTAALGGDLSWQGIRIENPGGAVTISNTANVLTLGSAGIDLSAATQNLTIGTSLVSGATQTWSLGTGRTLNLWTVNTARGISGFGDINLSGPATGSATVVMLPGASGSAGFSDANSNSAFFGNWSIGPNVTVQNIRNGRSAWGSGVIQLNGGTIAQVQGNWTWTNQITLGTGTTSAIANSSTGSNRYLKLQGIISGDGNLSFADTTGAMGNNTLGFILTGDNTLSGTVNIPAGRFVRVGGVGGDSVATGAGASGTLGTATIVNDGTLTLSRNNTWTYANNVSGSGVLNIGNTGIAGTDTQVATVSGTNTYTGATNVNAGRLHLTGTLTSPINVAAGARISGTGSTSSLLTLNAGSAIFHAGGATMASIAANGVNLAGATALTFETAPIPTVVYDVFTYGAGGVANGANLSALYRGTFADDALNQKYTFTAGAAGTRTWATTDGVWEIGGATLNWIEGDQKFYNGDTAIFGDIATDAVVTLAGRLMPEAVTVNNAANSLTFNGTAGPNEITGDAALTKSGAGTLKIQSRQTYTGGTIVNGGTLDLTGGGGAIGTIRGTVTVKQGATFQLSVNDATGYNTDGTRVSGINLEGGTMHVNTTANQTLGSAVVNLTGGSITGIAGSNLDLFANGTAVNTLASATTSTISIPSMNLRQNDTVFDVADGAAAIDLLITARLGDGSAGNHNLIKNGAGTMQLTANNTFGAANAANQANVTINGGVLDIASGGLYRTAAGGEDFNSNAVITINTGGTLRLRSFAYNGEGGTGGLADRRERRVLNGGTIEVLGATHSSGNDFTVTAAGGTFRYNPDIATDTLTLAGNALTNIQTDGLLTVDAIGNVEVTELIEGSGSLAKTGAGTLSLDGANAYTGTTTVLGGTLLVGGSISGSVVSVTGGTLGGTGTVGPATIDLGGNFAPGEGIGALTVGGTLTLGGTATFEIDKTGGTLLSDLASATALISYGGTLTVAATGETLVPGDIFNLFDAPAFDGSFSTFNLPALSDGSYAWDTTNLAIDGTLAVVPEPASTFSLLIGAGIIAGRRRRG